MKQAKFITLDNLNNFTIINDVVVRRLKVSRDNRGILVETLKTNWSDCYSKDKPFAQNYFSITAAGVARDEDQWHVHKNQADRFVVVKGDIILALCDGRQDSSTYKELNLFKMGESNGEKGQYLLLIPPKVLHCFLNKGLKEAIILNFPTLLYNPKEEGRTSFNKFLLKDKTYFSWDLAKRQ